jgi:hypothetical protein
MCTVFLRRWAARGVTTPNFLQLSSGSNKFHTLRVTGKLKLNYEWRGPYNIYRLWYLMTWDARLLELGGRSSQWNTHVRSGSDREARQA